MRWMSERAGSEDVAEVGERWVKNSERCVRDMWERGERKVIER